MNLSNTFQKHKLTNSSITNAIIINFSSLFCDMLTTYWVLRQIQFLYYMIKVIKNSELYYIYNKKISGNLHEAPIYIVILHTLLFYTQ